jgi:hypothetical protein
MVALSADTRVSAWSGDCKRFVTLRRCPKVLLPYDSVGQAFRQCQDPRDGGTTTDPACERNLFADERWTPSVRYNDDIGRETESGDDLTEELH